MGQSVSGHYLEGSSLCKRRQKAVCQPPHNTEPAVVQRGGLVPSESRGSRSAPCTLCTLHKCKKGHSDKGLLCHGTSKVSWVPAEHTFRKPTFRSSHSDRSSLCLKESRKKTPWTFFQSWCNRSSSLSSHETIWDEQGCEQSQPCYHCKQSDHVRSIALGSRAQLQCRWQFLLRPRESL